MDSSPINGSFESLNSSSSSMINMMQSAVDRQTQFMEGYTEIMRKMNRENLRRKLETAQVSDEEISSYKVKCEAMDEMMNLVERQSITTVGYGKTLSPATGSEAEDGKTPGLRKGGHTETLLEVLKEVEKSRTERKSMIPADKPSSSQSKNDLKVVGGKLSVLGMGGVGETVIHNNGSTNNYSFGTVQLTNRFYVKKKTNGR